MLINYRLEVEKVVIRIIGRKGSDVAVDFVWALRHYAPWEDTDFIQKRGFITEFCHCKIFFGRYF